jgi:methylmalonyl-CoA mutase N-terminal domain/subunit
MTDEPRPLPTDAELVAAAATVASALAYLRGVTAAKQAAIRQFAPRVAVRLSSAQLDAAYEHSQLRNPRVRPWVRPANDDRSAA